MSTYYDENRDKLLVNQRAYYQANKNKINEKSRNSKIICECGSSITKGHEKRHYETKKHQNFLSNSYGNSSPSLQRFAEPERIGVNNTENSKESENLSR